MLCSTGLPYQWLEIAEGDDEKTKARKKKLLKSMKSKMRFQVNRFYIMDWMETEISECFQGHHVITILVYQKLCIA
jgi:hypothetical protein